MPHEVTDNPERSRYEITEHGRVIGVVDYRLEGDVVVLPHTEVDPARQGQGLAAELVQAALDAIRARGQCVVPRCWYVAKFIADHAEYEDLLAP